MHNSRKCSVWSCHKMNVFPSLFMKWCKKTRSARGSCVMGVKAENKCIGGKKMPEKNSRHLNKISSFFLNQCWLTTANTWYSTSKKNMVDHCSKSCSTLILTAVKSVVVTQREILFVGSNTNPYYWLWLRACFEKGMRLQTHGEWVTLSAFIMDNIRPVWEKILLGKKRRLK